jgi:hypothetical protein
MIANSYPPVFLLHHTWPKTLRPEPCRIGPRALKPGGEHRGRRWRAREPSCRKQVALLFPIRPIRIGSIVTTDIKEGEIWCPESHGCDLRVRPRISQNCSRAAQGESKHAKKSYLARLRRSIQRRVGESVLFFSPLFFLADSPAGSVRAYVRAPEGTRLKDTHCMEVFLCPEINNRTCVGSLDLSNYSTYSCLSTNYENLEFYKLSTFCGCSHQKDRKFCENDPLDVEKLKETAENEPLQI